MKVKFWGVRGSVPTPWKEAMEYGGNTSCVQIIPSEDYKDLIIFDGGTGLRLLGEDLIAQKKHTDRIGHVLLSHTHWDHIQGFPFFTPAFIGGNEFRIYGAKKTAERLENTLKGQMSHEYFPVQLEQMGASMDFIELKEETFEINNDIKITTKAFTHPGGVYGFRLEYNGYVVMYCTDMEYEVEDVPTSGLVEFVQGADILIMDSQYTPDEMAIKKGWGHSTPQAAATVAKEGNVKRLLLYHHDPNHSDTFLENIILTEAQAIFPESYLAQEGLVLDLAKL